MSFPPMFRMCPFPIVAIASKPASVRRAVRKSPKPSPSRVRCFIRRRSCSTLSCRYSNYRSRERRHISPPLFVSATAFGYAGFLSTAIVRGFAVCAWAGTLRKNRFAAASRSPEKQEVDRPDVAVHRAIRISPSTLHPNAGLVHAPGAIARAEMRPEPPLGCDGASLDRAENGRASDLHAAIQRHRLRIVAGDGKHRMPPRRPQDRLGGELPSLEFLTVDHSPAPISSGP
jgi:hypothetical protein